MLLYFLIIFFYKKSIKKKKEEEQKQDIKVGKLHAHKVKIKIKANDGQDCKSNAKIHAGLVGLPVS